MRSVAAIVLVLAMGATPVLAAEPADAPMSTAGASGTPPMDTATQIERYLADAAAEPVRSAAAAERDSGPRKIHGEVSVSVGTGGYRSGYLTADIPVGERSTVGVAVGHTDFGRNGGYYGYGGPVSRCLRGPDGFAASRAPTWNDPARLASPSYGCPLD
ncbi:hypothetical protein [Caulobacter mirabilis]|uniref:Uncharacterized protein n=1 Tax=Caulobacter mirabilis TaxID=69666 RepID=A0A2D2AVU8_9CAUL|nr:hypothetical protein [Caulobacter mirabilis]ATQ42139.1 hypothetical protein CSW64_06775 [Caulobacter mirabilis]